MPRKVLFVGWFFHPKVGGVETMMLEQARYLRDSGWDVSVLTSKIDNKPKREQFEGMTVFRTDFFNTTELYPLDKLEEEFQTILEEMLPNLIHFHNGSYPSGATDMTIGVNKVLAMLKVARKMNIPVIDHGHNAQLKHPELTKPVRDYEWDHLICVSNYVKGQWQKLGMGARQTSVVYNGIDVKSYADLLLSRELGGLHQDNRKIIFFPGRVISMATGAISPQKNFSLVLESLELLWQKGITHFQLVAVNNESLSGRAVETFKELSNRIDQGGLTQRVTFIPPILPDDMPKYYAAADVVCVPSFNETFGLVNLEAMASGKIAIASNTGAPKEYIRQGENGFLVDPYDPEALANLLGRLLCDDSLCQRIGLQARSDVENYSIQKMGAGVVAVYNEVLGDK